MEIRQLLPKSPTKPEQHIVGRAQRTAGALCVTGQWVPAPVSGVAHDWWALRILCPQGKEPSVRQLALLHFRNTITLSVKLEDALARAHARVPPAIVQMLLVLQVGTRPGLGRWCLRPGPQRQRRDEDLGPHESQTGCCQEEPGAGSEQEQERSWHTRGRGTGQGLGFQGRSQECDQDQHYPSWAGWGLPPPQSAPAPHSGPDTSGGEAFI